MSAPAWDRSLAYQMTRKRWEHYQDVVDRLMREEAKLLPSAGEDAREAIIKLAASIQAVEKLGGDASALRAERDRFVTRLQDLEPRLAAVQLALVRARECMKWADMASEGMHWLCFAEPAYERDALPEGG